MNKDRIFTDDKYICGLRAAGVLVKDNMIPVQRDRDGIEYALPGGHIKIGETLEPGLTREIVNLSRQEVAEKYPYIEVAPHEAVYEQESALEFRFRADFMLSKIISETDEDKTTAVVTHGGMINQLYRSFLRLPAL